MIQRKLFFRRFYKFSLMNKFEIRTIQAFFEKDNLLSFIYFINRERNFKEETFQELRRYETLMHTILIFKAEIEKTVPHRRVIYSPKLCENSQIYVVFKRDYSLPLGKMKYVFIVFPSFLLQAKRGFPSLSDCS